MQGVQNKGLYAASFSPEQKLKTCSVMVKCHAAPAVARSESLEHVNTLRRPKVFELHEKRVSQGKVVVDAVVAPHPRIQNHKSNGRLFTVLLPPGTDVRTTIVGM